MESNPRPVDRYSPTFWPLFIFILFFMFYLFFIVILFLFLLYIILFIFLPSVSRIPRDFGKKINTKEKIVGLTITPMIMGLFAYLCS